MSLLQVYPLELAYELATHSRRNEIVPTLLRRLVEIGCQFCGTIVHMELLHLTDPNGVESYLYREPLFNMHNFSTIEKG